MREKLPKGISEYMSKIGAKGGKKSKRTLTPEQARKMVEAREKKRQQKKSAERSGTRGRTDD
jgi:ribosome assembly protein YihI (activator of Der GTPase)